MNTQVLWNNLEPSTVWRSAILAIGSGDTNVEEINILFSNAVDEYISCREFSRQNLSATKQALILQEVNAFIIIINQVRDRMIYRWDIDANLEAVKVAIKSDWDLLYACHGYIRAIYRDNEKARKKYQGVIEKYEKN